MHRVALFILLALLTACSQDSDSAAGPDSHPEIEDGTLVNKEHRQVVYDYYDKLKLTDDVEAERKIVTEFAGWLNEHKYMLKVESAEDGKTRLYCPHMPTETPWTEYTFKDAKHLNLLPQHQNTK